MPKRSAGARRWQATFRDHDGSQSAHGYPDYTDATTWNDFAVDWPCELVGASGTEGTRNQQTTTQTTHIAYGDFAFVENVTTDMIAVIDNVIYEIVRVMDMDGDRTEMTIELKREV